MTGGLNPNPMRPRSLVLSIGPYTNECVLRYDKASHSLSIHTTDGELFMVVTRQLPGLVLPDAVIAVKNYSENSGIAEILYGLGVLSKPLYVIPCGYAQLLICMIDEDRAAELSGPFYECEQEIEFDWEAEDSDDDTERGDLL